MKTKLFIPALAALTLAGCTSDEVLLDNSTGESAIGFSTYVENSTRAQETTLSNLKTFKVWATKARNAETTNSFVTILSATDVNKNATGQWVYSPTKYWVQENAYSFTAIGSCSGNASNFYTMTLPENVNSGEYLTHYLGNLVVDNQAAKGEEDLVWASNKVPTLHASDVPGQVKFSFKHLLSRVNIKFVNVRTIDDQIKISNVYVNNAATGTLDLTNTPITTSARDFSWTPEGTFTCNYLFGTGGPSSKDVAKNYYIETENKFLIPGQDQIVVSFDAYTSVTGPTEFVNITKTVKFNSTETNEAFKDISLKPGYSYTLIAYIGDDLDNQGKIDLTVVAVDTFTPAVTDTYLLDATLGTEQTFKFYSGDDASDVATKMLSVNQVQINPHAELVYYGKNPETYVAEDYKYEWTLPVDNGCVAFVENSSYQTRAETYYYTAVFPIGTVNSVSDLSAYIKFIGDTSNNYSDIIVTFTAYDSEDNVVVKRQQPIHFSHLSNTGGSQDGDDNDG